LPLADADVAAGHRAAGPPLDPLVAAQVDGQLGGFVRGLEELAGAVRGRDAADQHALNAC
jgi:hypothetical protein